MAATAEIEKTEVLSQVVEIPTEFPETIQQVTSGAQVVQKTFKSNVNDSSGQPIIQTPPTQVVTSITPPGDTVTLTAQSKGKITESATWLAMFWLRIIKKAIHFGWKIVGGGTT